MLTARRLWLLWLVVLSALAALPSGASGASEPSIIAFSLRNGNDGTVLPKNPNSERVIDGDDSGPPSWSPNGETLSYQHLTPGASQAVIKLVDRHTGKVTKITFPPPRTFVNGAGHTLPYGYDGANPTWAPNGREIAYGCFRGKVYVDPTPSPFPPGADDRPQPNICVMNLVSGESHVLAESTENRWIGASSWSPDGNEIAATAEIDGHCPDATMTCPSEEDILTVSAESGAISTLVRKASYAHYSQNGEKIVYTDLTRQNSAVVADADGGDPKVAFNPYDPEQNTYLDPQASFSPDSKDLVVSANGENGNRDLFEVKADGTTDTPIQYTQTGGDDEYYPVWAPPVTTCTVPKLKGKTLKEAKTAIELAACSLGKVKGNKKGKVVHQSPKPNRDLKVGTKVDIKLAKKH